MVCVLIYAMTRRPLCRCYSTGMFFVTTISMSAFFLQINQPLNIHAHTEHTGTNTHMHRNRTAGLSHDPIRERHTADKRTRPVRCLLHLTYLKRQRHTLSHSCARQSLTDGSVCAAVVVVVVLVVGFVEDRSMHKKNPYTCNLEKEPMHCNHQYVAGQGPVRPLIISWL